MVLQVLTTSKTDKGTLLPERMKAACITLTGNNIGMSHIRHDDDSGKEKTWGG